MEDFAHRLVDQRIDPRKANIDWAAFRDAQREPSNEAVASALVLDQIAQRDDIGVSENEIDAELEKYSRRTGLTAPAVRARLEQEGGLERLVAGLRREKALSRVMDAGQDRRYLARFSLQGRRNLAGSIFLPGLRPGVCNGG